MAIERTLSIIKPDATKKNLIGKIIAGALEVIALLVTGMAKLAEFGASYLSNIKTNWDRLASGINSVRNAWQKLKDLVDKGINFPSLPSPGGIVNRITGRAAGGYITSPEFAVIGEGRFNEFVFNAEQMRGLAAEGIQLAGQQRNTGGGNTYITEVHVAGSVLGENELASTITRLQRDGRLVGV